MKGLTYMYSVLKEQAPQYGITPAQVKLQLESEYGPIDWGLMGAAAV